MLRRIRVGRVPGPTAKSHPRSVRWQGDRRIGRNHTPFGRVRGVAADRFRTVWGGLVRCRTAVAGARAAGARAALPARVAGRGAPRAAGEPRVAGGVLLPALLGARVALPGGDRRAVVALGAAATGPTVPAGRAAAGSPGVHREGGQAGGQRPGPGAPDGHPVAVRAVVPLDGCGLGGRRSQCRDSGSGRQKALSEELLIDRHSCDGLELRRPGGGFDPYSRERVVAIRPSSRRPPPTPRRPLADPHRPPGDRRCAPDGSPGEAAGAPPSIGGGRGRGGR